MLPATTVVITKDIQLRICSVWYIWFGLGWQININCILLHVSLPKLSLDASKQPGRSSVLFSCAMKVYDTDMPPGYPLSPDRMLCFPSNAAQIIINY
jgi:hypothetical protein